MKKILFIPLFIISFHVFGKKDIKKMYLEDISIIEDKIQGINDSKMIFLEFSEIFRSINLVKIRRNIYENVYKENYNINISNERTLIENNQKDEKDFQIDTLKKKFKTEKNITEEDSIYTGVLNKKSFKSLLEFQIGVISPIIFGPENWTSTKGGLALRHGYGGEIGINVKPLKFLGITVSHAFTNYFSFLPEIFQLDTTIVSKRQKISLINRPSSIKINIYPKDDIVLSAGFLLSSLSISNSDQGNDSELMKGFTFGLGKIFPVGDKKNYISFTTNYSILNMEGFFFSLNQEKFPEIDPLVLNFKSLNTIDFKLQFNIFSSEVLPNFNNKNKIRD